MKKRCKFCHKWFTPHPQAPHQRCCSSPACRKKRKAAADKNWWLNNPKYGQSRRPKIKAWAKEYPDYWRKYRKEHPDYVEKDRRRRRSAHQKAKNAAKQDAVRQISVEKLESIRDLTPICAAKQDAVHRRVNGILDYLFWKESAAKQDNMVNCLASGP
ncbi:hypothetical protein HZA43_04280 [Candidatus Peregrinibacteria bacterium]|nr:hypothetical protein [Candidatus Peregrinibacteria bacterium]